MPQNFYPASQISRNLDPTQKSLRSVVGRHDQRITDADVNLIQDVQDAKRKDILDNMTFSGMLSGSPFVFQSTSGSFMIPAFDVLFNGEVVTIGGANIANLTQNRVLVPAPSFWTYGLSGDPINIYVVYLELWYTYIDPTTGAGYYIDPSTQNRFFYPNGCIQADPSSMIPDDLVDPFEGLVTSGRVQIQWALRVASLPASYDFSTLQAGLDMGPNIGEVVYGQAAQSQTIALNKYQFANLGSTTGDFGLWRAGVNSPMSELGTLDGYSYAIPVAVLSQRNTGDYSITTNPFGCKSSQIQNSGLLIYGISGRPDNKFADVVYPGDTVDTRMSVSINGEDNEVLLEQGFTDLATGLNPKKISRGDGNGVATIALGSTLPYTVSLGPAATVNTQYLGPFDGFMNGFSSDGRTFLTTKMISTSMKAIGNAGSRWTLGDAFSVSLSQSGSVISSVVVQSIKNNPDGSVTPIMLYTGQLSFTGLGTSTLSCVFNHAVQGTSFDPSTNPLFLTLGITYPANSSYNLQVNPVSVDGGVLTDSVAGTFPVYGVSEYEISVSRNLSGITNLLSYNPRYSSSTFGTFINYRMPSSAGVRSISNSSVITTFTIPNNNIWGDVTGAFIVSAKEVVRSQNIDVANRSYINGNLSISLFADYSQSQTVLEFTILLLDTAQVSYNAPVKGVLAIEEVVMVGQNLDSTMSTDPRVQILNVSQSAAAATNTIILAASDCMLRGIAGDYNGIKQIFIKDSFGNYNGYPIVSAYFSNGLVTLTFSSANNNGAYKGSWFIVMSILPAFSTTSSLVLTSTYVPYQGEGVAGRQYSILYSEDQALVTTNGTGASPIVGITDVFPFNRELPLCVSLPAQPTWKDSDLSNQPLDVFIDNNYVAKQQSNIDNVVRVPLHTNDFIEPIAGWKKKAITLSTPSGRGFTKAYPHVGFAIKAPQPGETLGDAVKATAGPLVLYVNNIGGNDSYDGSSLVAAKQTIQGALSSVPSILRHPVTIYLVDSGQPYKVVDLQTSNLMDAAVFGDGVVRNLKYYCIYNLSFEVQGAGRLLISNQPNATNPIEISALGASPYGDGATTAFFISGSRALFNGILFTNFVDEALKVLDSNVELVNCSFSNNTTTISAEEGSEIILSGGTTTLQAGQLGLNASNSSVTSNNHSLVANAGCGSFYVCDMNSDLNLTSHSPAQETNVTSSTVIATVKVNSSIICSNSFTSSGCAQVYSNSLVVKSGPSPFLGGVSNPDGSVQVPVVTDVDLN